MTKLTATVGFNLGTDDSLDVEIDRSEVIERLIPAVTRDVPVMVDGDDGEAVQAQDPETGAALFTTEIVTPRRWETLEEALRRTLADNLYVGDVETHGITRLSLTVQYSGEFELELEGEDLDDFGEQDPEDITAEDIQGLFDDTINEGVWDDVNYGGPQVEIVYFEAE